MNPHKKHILLVNLSKTWGGGEKWFYINGKALTLKGWKVDYLVYPNSALQQKLSKENIPHYSLKLRLLGLLNPSVLLGLLSIIKKICPSYLLLNASHELKTAGWLGKYMGIPHIILRRGLSFPFKANGINHFFVSKVMGAFLTNSRDSFENFAHAFPQITSKSHTVIRNGVATDLYQPELQVPGKICIASRLSKEKGITLAIEAMSRIKAENSQLDIWGEGPEKEALEMKIKALKLQDRVTLHGFESNLGKKMAQCSVFLLPSTHGEGTSNSLIEAMSLGLPAIAFDVPSMKETIIDGETGFIVSQGNIEEYARKIQVLIQDETLRKKMGKAARERCLAIYSQEKATEDLIQWLEALDMNKA